MYSDTSVYLSIHPSIYLSTIEHQVVIDIACGERFSLLLDEEAK